MGSEYNFIGGIGGVFYILIFVALKVFVLILAWRAMKALEKSANAQTETAESLRQLIISKSKEENR